MTVYTETKGISRREFLYYIWGAGAGLLGMGVCGASVWFAFPHSEISKHIFSVDLSKVQLAIPAPVAFHAGKFWLINTANGLYAFSFDCTFRGCYVKWVPTNIRFECPCCGSKFAPDGTYIEGPAPRHLDRYPFYVTTLQGTISSKDGSPISIEGATKIVVDVREKIPGKFWWK